MTSLARKHLRIPFFATALAIAGCSASTSPTGTTTTEGSMVAMVNGDSWSSTVIPPDISGGATAKIDGSGALTITANSMNHGTIALVLLHPKLGADTLGVGDNGSYITDDNRVYLTAGPNQGIVNLSTYDPTHHEVSGTFSFIAQRVDSVSSPTTVTVTNGSFYDVEWSAK